MERLCQVTQLMGCKKNLNVNKNNISGTTQ